MDPDFLWHALSGGALITAAVALARLLLDYVVRPERALEGYARKRRERDRERVERERLDRERRECERDEQVRERARRLRHERDAEARLERILQDRLADADRRLERSDAELCAARVRVAALEHDLLQLQQAYEVLGVEYTSLLQLAEAQRPSR
jgi:hypothetical protein